MNSEPLSSVVWLHDDALRHWYGLTPAVYVFDVAKLKLEQWSLKRIGFIYECLLELPVEIRLGNPIEQITAFQRLHSADRVVIMDTPDPRLCEQLQHLSALTSVEVLLSDPFIPLTGTVDLRRFSRYWTKAERWFLTMSSQSDV